MTFQTGLRAALLCALVLPFGPTELAAAQTARAERTVVQNVRLSFDDDAPRVHLVLRQGRVESVLDADAATPPGARIVDAL